MDVMPTLLEVVGKPVPANLDLDGVSLLGQLRGKNKEKPHEFLFHHCGTDIFAMRWIKDDGQVIKSLRVKWKSFRFSSRVKFSISM